MNPLMHPVGSNAEGKLNCINAVVITQISIGSIESVLFFCPCCESFPSHPKCLSNKKCVLAPISEMVYSLQDNPFPERPTLEEPMKKLISLLVMILLLLTAALAETSTPTCTTVTLATGSVRGGFPREDA